MRLALLSAGLAAVALVVAGFGDIRAEELHRRLLNAGAAVLFVLFAVLAVRSVAEEVQRAVASRDGIRHAAALRLGTLLTGYVAIALLALDVLAVPIQHLLLGGPA